LLWLRLLILAALSPLELLPSACVEADADYVPVRAVLLGWPHAE
jgi:hypothetical protein